MARRLILAAVLALSMLPPPPAAHALSGPMAGDAVAAAWLQASLPGAQLTDVRDYPLHLPFTHAVLHRIKAIDAVAATSVGGVFGAQGGRLADGGRAVRAAERRAQWIARGGMVEDLWNELGTLQPAAYFGISWVLGTFSQSSHS